MINGQRMWVTDYVTVPIRANRLSRVFVDQDGSIGWMLRNEPQVEGRSCLAQPLRELGPSLSLVLGPDRRLSTARSWPIRTTSFLPRVTPV